MFYLEDITSFWVGYLKLRRAILHGSNVFRAQESEAHALDITKKFSGTTGARNWPIVPRLAKNTSVDIQRMWESRRIPREIRFARPAKLLIQVPRNQSVMLAFYLVDTRRQVIFACAQPQYDRCAQ